MHSLNTWHVLLLMNNELTHMLHFRQSPKHCSSGSFETYWHCDSMRYCLLCKLPPYYLQFTIQNNAIQRSTTQKTTLSSDDVEKLAFWLMSHIKPIQENIPRKHYFTFSFTISEACLSSSSSLWIRSLELLTLVTDERNILTNILCQIFQLWLSPTNQDNVQPSLGKL